jgi:hypothetical protein
VITHTIKVGPLVVVIGIAKIGPLQEEARREAERG